MGVSQGEEVPDGLHGRRVASRFAVGKFGVGLGVVIVGAPFAEGLPADLAEEFGGEAAGEDGELGLAVADEVEVIVDDAGGLGFTPDGHSFRGGEFFRETREGDGVCWFSFDDGAFEVVGGGGAGEGLDEEFGISAAGEHLVVVIAGMDAVDEVGDVEAAGEAVVVKGGQDVLDGGGDGVGESRTVVFRKTLKAGERGFESCQEADEFCFVSGHLG